MTPDRNGWAAPSSLSSDVVVIGGGLAGLAASIRLSRAGLSVLCLEPVVERERIVGESLDWSGPELLRWLGLEMEDLVATGVATYKRHVSLRLQDGSGAEYVPSEWLGKAPFHVELRTIHVDRMQLDAAIRRIAAECGVRTIRDRAAKTEWGGKQLGGHLAAVIGESGVRYEARWFVDASGYASSFLGRQVGIPVFEYGPKKVGIWSYFKTPDWQQGTTLYAESLPDTYLKWIWQIPIAPGETSVGLVTSGPMFKASREHGEAVAQVFRSQMEATGELQALVSQPGVENPSVTSFSCRVLKQVAGPNWLIAGEAAALPDPITGNGVTSALRHAFEGGDLIIKAHQQGRKTLPWFARRMYTMRVVHVCRFFDSLVEKLVYDCAIRDRFGLRKAGDVYTSIAWSMNHLYSRFKPRGVAGTVLFCAALTGFRAAGRIAERLCLLLARKPKQEKTDLVTAGI